MTNEDDEGPPPFNPRYRPGYGPALGRAYNAWSNANPGHSRDDGVKAYRSLAENLKRQYPQVCPKCENTSGNDWSQCGGECPMQMSPHYKP